MTLSSQTLSCNFHPRESLMNRDAPICPLTGRVDIKILETFPTSLLIDCYRRDLGLDVTAEFEGVLNLQLCRCRSSDLMFFYPCMTGSSEFYRKLQTFNWYFPETKFEYDHAATWIRPNQHILDIGCGAAQFVKKFSTISYTGLEPHSFPTQDLAHHDIHILPETIAEHAMTHAQTYDVICAFQVLEHVPNPCEFLTTALACLKPNGLFILGVPSAESYITRITNFVLNAPPHHVTWWSDQALQNLADQFHLSILDLVHAPVESWETRLYWMQRLTQIFVPRKTQYFTELRSRRLANVAAYIGAGLMMPFASPSPAAQGSTVVMVARKEKLSPC